MNTIIIGEPLPRSIKRQKNLAEAMSFEIMAPPEQTELESISIDVDIGLHDVETMFSVFHYTNTITGVSWDIAVRNDGKVVKLIGEH